MSFESENESQGLKVLLSSVNEGNVGLSLIELNLINVEKTMKIKLNEHMIEFIKGMNQTLTRLSINNFEFEA